MEVVIKYPGDDALKGVPTPTEVISESESVKSGKATCEVITGPECLLDILPSELLDLIASMKEPAYKAMLAYPRFARAVTPRRLLDYKESFGHSTHILKNNTEYRRNGLRHRLDGPASISDDGLEIWYRNGVWHRVDDEPTITHPDGRRYWYRNGVLHRDDGPAVIRANGDKFWYRNGVMIRTPYRRIIF